MSLKRKSIKTAALIWLRKVGVLCKKPTTPKGIRLYKSVLPDGTEVFYDKPLKSQPQNPHSLESEVHVYHEMQKDAQIKYGHIKKAKQK